MEQKRKKLIIDKKFQGSFIGISLVFAITAIILNYLAMWFVFKSGVMFKTPLHQLTEAGDDIQWMLHIYFLINIIMFIIFMLWAGIVMTNQVAGPLYRLKNHMSEIMETSDIRPFVERKGDLYFRPLLHTYNEFLEWIKNKS
ncbi:MAG: hypothetical protein MK008_11690 [Bdellovibrionales bacterium]|nr:hypothetical protein [Bdellovibrionales bacterium]